MKTFAPDNDLGVGSVAQRSFPHDPLVNRCINLGNIDMTKKVRIENADTSDHKLVVQTWQKGADGEPDNMVSEQELNNPTDLCDGMVWQEQYLVIKEVA